MMKKVTCFFLFALIILTGCNSKAFNSKDVISYSYKEAEAMLVQADKSDYDKYFITKDGKKYINLEHLYSYGNGEVIYGFVLVGNDDDIIAYDFKGDEFLKIREISYVNETDFYVNVGEATKIAYSEDRSIILERQGGAVELERILFSEYYYCLEQVPETQGEIIKIKGEKYLLYNSIF